MSAAASSASNQTKAENVPAIERASNRSWIDWLALFDAAGAAKLPHPEIARIARAAMPDTLKNPDWWAQGTAIAFEQHVGIRVPGQSSTGEFRVSASRTMSCDRDESIARWIARFASHTHLGHEAESVRQSRTEKRTFWRASLVPPASAMASSATNDPAADDSAAADSVMADPATAAHKLEVAAEAKPDGRSLVAISHTGLPGADAIEQWRSHWKACLGEL